MVKSLNWPGVITAFLFGQLLGYVWYSLLFGGALHVAMSPGARTPVGVVEGAGLQLVMVIGLNLILNRMNAHGLLPGAKAGALLWFFLPFVGEVMNVLYVNEGWTLFLANAGYTLIFLTVAGALVAGLKFNRSGAAA